MGKGEGGAGTCTVYFPFLPMTMANVPEKVSCWFSTRSDFAPQEIFGNAWRHLDCHHWDGYYWHLVGRGQ